MRAVHVFVSPRGNAFMRDIATWIAEAAAQTGRPARVEHGRPTDPAVTNLVVAPHELYLLGGFGDREVHESTRISVPVCTEQPGTTWFEITRLLAEASPFAIDINTHGVAALRHHGVAAHHLRLGGVPSMDRRRPGDRPIELLFLGGRTPRRGERLAELAPLLHDREVDLRLFSFTRPVTEGVDGLVFGTAKYDLLASSRILLNVHRDESEPGYFEWARMVEAMANGCCVVTEPSSGFEPLVPGEHFVVGADLAGEVAALLDDPGRAAAIGARAADAVLVEHPLVETLAPVLERIEATPTVLRRRRRSPRYGTRTLRAQQIPLLPVFTPTATMRRRIYHALTAETLLQRQIERARCLVRHGVEDHVERVASPTYDDAAPEVSVVVTLYDYAGLVVETLDSIAASVDVALELIVVDDHSTDDGRDAVRRWIADHPSVPALLLGSDINRGLPAARNLGFANARAAKVMVMDADNLVYPAALRRLADALDADPGAAFAYSILEEFGTQTGVRSAMGWHVPWLCEANYIDAQAMIRHEAWDRAGGYRTDDELVFGWEDWELWLRLAAAGEHGVHVPQMLGRYRTQAQSMISTSNLVADHMRRHLRDLHPQLPWPTGP